MASLASWYMRWVLIITLAHGATGQDNITDDSFFFGQSPPVYPSPLMPGSPSWAAAYSKAQALVSQMTLEEKSNITVGWNPSTGCSGETGSVPRLNWPGLCLSDAGNGVRSTDFVNSWPSGLHVGASWNAELAFQRANHMGNEFRTKGVHVALGPVVGPLGRVYEGGRNWEGFSNDPYLCGVLAAKTVSGIQGAGVTTSVKHYIGNEQELNRLPFGNVSSISANIDDKTMHELYLWPFADAVRAGAGSIMCSYNRINNSFGCQNSKTLNGLLKAELGFEGFVVSDWFAQRRYLNASTGSGLASAEAGLDVVMPFSPSWGPGGENLTVAVQNGSLAASRVTDMATRLVASWYQMSQDTGFPDKGTGMPKDFTIPYQPVDARDPSSREVLLQGAIEGHVLVKNTNHALPLKKPQLLSIFGYDAVAPPAMNVPKTGEAFVPWTVGGEPQLGNTPLLLQGAAYAPNGTMIRGGGSGANAPAYISAPFDAIRERAYIDRTSIFYDITSGNPTVATASDACFVFINAWASEGADRPSLRDDFSDGLVLNVASKCPNTIVVIHNAGPRLVDQWIDNPNVTALVFAHLPGQDSGRALAQILYGDLSPSGKLPYTVAKNESDYNTLSPSAPKGKYQLFPQSNFSEGEYIDYRYFDQVNKTPRFEFGYGLTYTTFSYSNLEIDLLPEVSNSYFPPASPTTEGGIASLWDVIARVQATVTNTGDYEAAEVVQLYIGIPGGPRKQLRGFNKFGIPVGGSVKASFDLLRRDLSQWSVVEQSWILQQGQYQVFIGSSSRELPLQGSLTI